MSNPDADRLIGDFIAGARDPETLAALADAAERDPAVARTVARSLAVDRMLQQLERPALDADRVMRALPSDSGGAFQERVLGLIARADRAGGRRRSPSGLRRGLAVAAGIIIAAALIGSLMMIRPAHSVAEVASLRGVQGAIWGEQRPAHDHPGEMLGAGRLDLRSGLAELAFAGGATVVIEGPTEVVLESSRRVRLLRGRAVAQVPAAARGFTVVAADLEVVDLGTEFAVELGAAGAADVHVFKGVVEAHAPGTPPAGERLLAGQAVRANAGAGALRPIVCDQTRFTRTLHPAQLDLDLSDMVAGGDGRGGGARDGIDPTDGRLRRTPALGFLHGDGGYHTVPQSPCIDGVFIPDGHEHDNIITSLGHHFRFPPSDGAGYDLIRRGGTLEHPSLGGSGVFPRIPPVFGGVDYATSGHTVIGLHANAGFTIDLRSLAAVHRGMRVERFTAQVANIGRKGGGEGMADFWLLVDGQMRAHYAEMTATSGPVAIDLLLHASERFLTLVATDSGNGYGLDWITLGDARLRLLDDAPGR